MINPAMIRALVYAGLISNILAIIVCLLFTEFAFIPGRSMVLAIWTSVYIIYKKFLGIW